MPGNEHRNTPAILFAVVRKVGRKINLLESGP
jgi:hypothetical protein